MLIPRIIYYYYYYYRTIVLNVHQTTQSNISVTCFHILYQTTTNCTRTFQRIAHFAIKIYVIGKICMSAANNTANPAPH